MQTHPLRQLARPSLLLACSLLGAGCTQNTTAPATAYPAGGTAAHNIDVEPGMPPEARAAAKRQLQQMQQAATQKR